MENPTVTAVTIRSINMDQIGCNPKAAAALEEGDKRVINLATIMGIVNAVVVGETEIGQYIALAGKFRAINEQEGTSTFGATYESGIAFLPPGIHDKILADVRKVGIVEPDAIDKRQKKTTKSLKDGREVKFAVQIGVKRDKNASGITYVGVDLLPPTEADPLAEVQKALTEARITLQKALNAGSPVAEEQKALPPAKGRK